MKKIGACPGCCYGVLTAGVGCSCRYAGSPAEGTTAGDRTPCQLDRLPRFGPPLSSTRDVVSVGQW
jgi:hypothetical protein